MRIYNELGRFSALLPRMLFGIIMCAVFFGGDGHHANAAPFTWDADGVFGNGNQDGGGTWSTSNAHWNDGASDVVWPNSVTNDDAAVFGVGSGAAGTVNVSGTVNVNSITFNAPGSGNYTIGGTTLTLNGTTPTITANVNATITAPLAGSAGLIKSGIGTLTLSTGNGFTGGTVISQGTLISGHATALSTGTITLGDGSTGSNNVRLQFNASVPTPGSIGNITVANAGSGTATLAISANIGVNTDLILNRDTVIASTGGTPNNQVYKGTISGPGAGAGNNTITIENGAGNWLTQYVPTNTLNSYAGNLHIKTGNLQIGSYNGAGVSVANQNKAIPDTASVRIESGSTMRFVWTGGAEAIDGLNGDGNIDRNTVDGQGNIAFTVGANNGGGSFGGAITSSIALIKAGAGTQILSGANTYAGSTTVQNGILQLTSASNRLPTGTTVTLGNLANSGKLVLGNTTAAVNQTVAGLLNSGTGTANAVVGGHASNHSILTVNNAGSITYAGLLGGAGTNENNLALIKSGAGTLTLSGLNTFTGNTSGPDFTGVRITGGILATDKVALNNNPSGIGGGSASLGISGGTFRYTGNGGTIERRLEVNTAVGSAIDASGTGALTWLNTGGFGGAGVGGARTLTLTGTSTALNNMGILLANPGNIANTLSVAKSGTGTWLLTQANTYTGNTTISDGTLLVNNSTGSGTGTGNVSVGSSGTLGGTGAISGSVNVTGTLSPGASIESLASGALTMNSGSTFVFEADNSDPNLADLMAVDGALSLTEVNLDLSGADLASVDWVVGDKLTLISYNGSAITSGFSGYDNNSIHLFGTNNWQFMYDDLTAGDNFQTQAELNGTQFVTMTLVPEPSSFAMLLFGGVMMWCLRRNRSA